MTDTNIDLLIAILSVGMAIILFLVIIALYYTIKILNSIRGITDKAERIADNVDSASQFFKKTAGPAAFGKMLANIIETIREKEGKKKWARKA